MTQFWHFARSMGLFSFIICHCWEITSGDFELGILDLSSIPGCPVGSVMGTHRDLGEDLKLPAVETAQCLYLQAYRKKGEEMWLFKGPPEWERAEAAMMVAGREGARGTSVPTSPFSHSFHVLLALPISWLQTEARVPGQDAAPRGSLPVMPSKRRRVKCGSGGINTEYIPQKCLQMVRTASERLLEKQLSFMQVLCEDFISVVPMLCLRIQSSGSSSDGSYEPLLIEGTSISYWVYNLRSFMDTLKSLHASQIESPLPRERPWLLLFSSRETPQPVFVSFNMQISIRDAVLLWLFL